MDTKSEKSLILKDYYTNLAGSIPVSRRIFKSPYFQRYSSKTLKVRFFCAFHVQKLVVKIVLVLQQNGFVEDSVTRNVS